MAYALGGLLLIWAVFMPLRFFYERKGRKATSLVFKAAGTLTAVAFAVFAVLEDASGNAYARWILTGLVLCTCADVLLAIKLEAGGGLFFLGHVAYIVAFLGWGAVGAASWVVFLFGLVMLLLFLQKHREGLPPKLFKGLQGYGLILAMLLATSLPLPLMEATLKSVLAAVGAALFVASDMTLLTNRVNKRGVAARYISLGLYYTGQLLLALSTIAK